MKMRKLFALLLVLCVAFSLCACGGNSDTNGDDKNDKVNNEVNDDDSTDESKNDAEDDQVQENKAAFKVTVVDEAGNPVKGVMVQVCKDSCIPAMSDDNGVASFNIAIESGHKLSVMSTPEGYEFSNEEIYLEAGATEYTLTIKKAQ